MTKTALVLTALVVALGLSACAGPASTPEVAPTSVSRFLQEEQVEPQPTETPIEAVEVAPVAPVATETEIIPPNSLPAGSPVPFQNGKFDTGACASGTAYVEADGSGTCVD